MVRGFGGFSVNWSSMVFPQQKPIQSHDLLFKHIPSSFFLRPSPGSVTLTLRTKSLCLNSCNSCASFSIFSSTPFSTHFRPHFSSRHPVFATSQSLNFLRPYILFHYKSIVAGWLCSLVSVISLSQIVGRIGKFSAGVGVVDAIWLRDHAVVLGGFVLARLILNYWQQAFLWDAALSAVSDVRVRVFESVLERDLGFFENVSGVPSGDIAYRITAEASAVADTLYALLNTIVPSALQLSAMAMQMLMISPTLSLVSAIVIPSMALTVAYIGEKQRNLSKMAHLSVANLSAYLNEVLPAILFVKANSAEACESTRFQRLAHTDLSTHLKKKKMKALVPQLIQTVYFGTLLILFVSSRVISKGSSNSSSMVSFITSLVFLLEPIQGVGKAYNELKQGEPAIDRLFELKKFKSKVIDKPDAIDLNSIRGEVKFCDVSFSYGNKGPLLLNGLNLHIKAGETVALIGPSGGGKTTLMKLLLRLYDPLSGTIFIDGHDIQNIRLKSLRKHISVVSQDITLFSGTVAENIGYKDLMTKIDMERVEYAARIANADEFISNLPDGYNTDIGPRGSILSGGQRQRLAIARALYKKSSILILDEATSALDSRAELLVREALQRLMESHTVLVIAHRSETVRMAKQVFVLEDGQLREFDHFTLLDDQLESDLLNKM